MASLFFVLQDMVVALSKAADINTMQAEVQPRERGALLAIQCLMATCLAEEPMSLKQISTQVQEIQDGPS